MGAPVGRRQPRAAKDIAVRAWHILRSRLRSLVFRGGLESDLSEELQLHLERETERLQASGLSREDARLQARRLFGGVEQIKEASRDARGTAALDALARDTRYGLRRLVRDWRFTTAAVLILGLAIGANTAIFSLVNAVLFREQAIAHPDRLVNIYQNDRAGQPLVVTSYSAYMEMAAYTDIFTATMAASIPNPVRYLHDGTIRDAVVEYATATYLDVLGLQPSLGRWFDETEERRGAPLVAVLGHQTWTRVFRADPSVVGRVIRIEGVPVTIVGIGPANHRGTVDVGVGTDLWLPITALPAITAIPAQRDATAILAPLFVKARLREGATVAKAKAAMDVLAHRLEADYPDLFRREGEFALGKGITVVPTTDVRIHPQADVPIMALASLVLVGRQPRPGHRVQQLGDAAAGARRRACEGSLGSAGHGRHAASACPAPTDRESAALAGGRHRRLHPGVVGHAGAARDRPPDQSRSDPGLPRARLCDCAVAGHGRGVRPGASAQGHEG